MLTHLCQSIKRFGPPILFSTERFEAFNAVTRNYSIHSNRMSPGRDISNQHNNQGLIRALVTGTPIYDNQHQELLQAGPRVTEVFESNILLQKCLGYNNQWNASLEIKIKGLPTQEAPYHFHSKKISQNLMA